MWLIIWKLKFLYKNILNPSWLHVSVFSNACNGRFIYHMNHFSVKCLKLTIISWSDEITAFFSLMICCITTLNSSSDEHKSPHWVYASEYSITLLMISQYIWHCTLCKTLEHWSWKSYCQLMSEYKQLKLNGNPLHNRLLYEPVV